MTADTAADDLLDHTLVAGRQRVAELHRRRGQDLFGFALGLGLTCEDAADAVQDTMLRLWRELAAGRPVVDEDAWAFRTIYRIAMDSHRLRRRFASLARLVPARREPSDPAASDDAAAVWEAVDRLTERQRAVLYLRYRADLPYERVAAVLGITAAGARSHASSALAALRRQFVEEES